jgi:hypothetical protein
MELVYISTGHAVAVVSRYLPVTGAWVRSYSRLCRIYGDESGTGAGLLRVLRFPLPVLIPQIVPYLIITLSPTL